MRKLLSLEEEKCVVNFYLETKNRVETCLKFNLKNSTFYSTLKIHGIKPDSNKQQNYNYNLDAFKDFEKDKRASYFYGLLLSDGCILDNGTVQLNLKSSDKQILDEFNDYIGSPRDLSYRVTKEGHSSYTAVFRNRLITSSLVYQGLSPRKSGNEKLPKFNWLDNPDFFRGLVDGDGAISISTSKSSSIELHNSLEVVTGFIDFVNKHVVYSKNKTPTLISTFENGSLYSVGFYGKTAVEILKILYYKDCLAIKRKIESAELAIKNKTRTKG